MKVNFNDFKISYLQRSPAYNRAFEKVMKSGWYILGKQVENFEKELAKYLGVKYVVGVANGLEALQISLMALNIGPNDEVITTPLSAVATTLAILAVGAKPVFVDTNENGQINADLIAATISKKTKAVLPVHLYGQACDLFKIKQICRQHKLLLIEDAAQAIGAELNGQKLGSFGDLNCFSFYPTKNLGAIGDGGAIVTNNKKLAEKCRMIRNYGQKSKYVHQVYGLNSRLDELQAALLRIKLKSLDKDNKARIKISKLYIKLLQEIKQIKIINPLENSISNYHLFVIKAQKRDQLQKYLKQKQIESLIHYPLIIPDQSFLKDQFAKNNFPVSKKLVKQILSLPCHPNLTQRQIEFVAKQIKNFYNL